MHSYRTLASSLLALGLFFATETTGQTPLRHFIDVGELEDDDLPFKGVYGREGPRPQSVKAFFRECSYRWFANNWSIKLPVFPLSHNLITIRTDTKRWVWMRVDNYDMTFAGMGDQGHEYTVAIPAEVIGRRTHVLVRGAVFPPDEVSPDAKDKRELAMAVDWISVQPVRDLPLDIIQAQRSPDEKEEKVPLPFRLRGTENRPLNTDVGFYVHQARLMRNNVMTVGPMDGRHFTAFPTRFGVPSPKMARTFIPFQVNMLHAFGIDAIGWLPFNVQDLRDPEQCEVAKKYPDWRMEFINWSDRSATNKVGMCVVSSPWREVHADILRGAARTGIDAAWFDGFFLGGIPHPVSPGCVCRYCREKFRKETNLDAPQRVDWNDMVFKRWVRWRNEKLVETAVYFRDKMHETNPKLLVSFNYNIWPFGDKDWDTAIPLWSTRDYGVSQHAYSARPDMEWVMLGFKSRISHDLNPLHSDIWRSAAPAWNFDNSVIDRARHELTMLTFMLSGLTYGTTPWHGGEILPHDIGIRVHEAVKQRERYFSQDEFRHVAVLLSQNTHDFYGHIPGTTNLADYRDTILATWLLLTERHVPFRFVFDNDVENGNLADYPLVLVPGAACLSNTAAARLAGYIVGGGRLIITGETGEFNEWGQRRTVNVLTGTKGVVRLKPEPALEWLRTRHESAAEKLLDALAVVPAPFSVEAPSSLAVNASWAPKRKALWLHLLNVSALYPVGDTGFHGVGGGDARPARSASDAAITVGGKLLRLHIPTEAIVVRAPGFNVKRASLAVSGAVLAPDKDNRFVIPSVDVHDALLLDLQ